MNPTYQEEYYKQYYYHSDHLGSASLISDYKGDEYQRIEYTPYGETWVEKTQNTGLEFLPYRFTGKEIDEETGLYYYGARYLDSKYSRWLSTDPALGKYIPAARKGTADEVGKLPGVGGIFNSVNGNLYHYAGNDPIKYTDPDGRIIINCDIWYAKDFMQMYNATWPNSKNTIARSGCTLIASLRASNVAINKFGYEMETPKPIGISNMLEDSSLTCSKGMIFSGLKDFLARYGVEATVIDTGKKGLPKDDIANWLSEAKSSKDSYIIIGRIPGSNEDHFVNINSYDSNEKKVNATDTSMNKLGLQTRDLKSVDVSTFDRLILIKVKSLEEN